MNLTIDSLKKGDLIEILAPAKAIEKEHVQFAKKTLEDFGFKVRVSKHCLGQYNYFSGTISQRLSDFQKAVDDEEVKAILCARGGYGCIQIVDKIQWANMLRFPKWIIGFSDVTVFHQKLSSMGLKSLHATMPLNFSQNSKESISTLVDAVKGEKYTIESKTNSFNQLGDAQGTLRGGNLSILFSLLGTDDHIKFENSILFIEDLAEQIYHLDRMLYALDKAGILNRIKGLVVGGMTDMKDTSIPFGMTYQEVILSHFEYRNIPICFNFPVGHINDNRALIIGSEVTFYINQDGAKLTFL
ncbi:MAG: LD-carboxypeptidase [Crocinitomicaceae bacterium]|nr:LD-carboxypeptidase [Crocinitomicaceae bacterium]